LLISPLIQRNREYDSDLYDARFDFYTEFSKVVAGRRTLRLLGRVPCGKSPIVLRYGSQIELLDPFSGWDTPRLRSWFVLVPDVRVGTTELQQSKRDVRFWL